MAEQHGWICCQRGAREHYAVARAFAERDELECLLTDFWWPLRSIALNRLVPASVRGRRHDAVHSKLVRSFGCGLAASLITQRLSSDGWYRQQQKQNQWFQRRCVGALTRLPDCSQRRVLFAYSYGAKDIFAYAKSRGWLTVLGQIDPGPKESEIVLEEYRRLGLSPGPMYRPPAHYWDDWREETKLADAIVVNSQWSAGCLQEEGVSGSKIVVIPCAYESSDDSRNSRRQYPATFNEKRPLEVLFLGQTIVRKGIHLLIEAARMMTDRPIHFVVAGGGLDMLQLEIPANVRWVGAVPRSQVAQFYREADVFILPTLSDGFALTQLEAQAWKLPVIASKRCGEVVSDGVNGVLLPEVSTEAIVAVIQRMVSSPDELQQMSDHSKIAERFSISSIGSQFGAIGALG